MQDAELSNYELHLMETTLLYPNPGERTDYPPETILALVREVKRLRRAVKEREHADGN